MKMTKLALAMVVAGAASASIVGCHDGKDRPVTHSTTITVFDGYGLGCDVTVNGIAADEDINGAYILTTSQELDDGAVISASNCTDADTHTILPTLLGVSQSGGAAVSPITTLIVAAAVKAGGDPANLTAEALTSAKNAVVTKLGLGSYDPTNPATANYVKDVNDNAASQQQMQLALALTTLLKTLEKAAGENAEAAIAALATAVTNSETNIDLGDVSAIQTLMSDAASSAGGDEAVFDALTNTSAAVADKVAQIANADSVGAAAAITQAITQTIDNGGDLEDVQNTDTTDLPPIDVGTHTDPDTGETSSSGGTGA